MRYIVRIIYEHKYFYLCRRMLVNDKSYASSYARRQAAKRAFYNSPYRDCKYIIEQYEPHSINPYKPRSINLKE